MELAQPFLSVACFEGPLRGDRCARLKADPDHERCCEEAEPGDHPVLSEVPGLAADDHPDAETEQGEHRGAERDRADDPQAVQEALDEVGLAAQDECRQQADDDQAAEPDCRGEDVQEQQPLIQARRELHSQAARLCSPSAGSAACSACCSGVRVRGSRRAGARPAAISPTATQKVVPKALARSGAACGWRESAAIPWMPPWKWGTLAAIARCRMIASSAVPIAPAIRWMALSALVALGVSSCASVWKAAAIEGTIRLPIPRPTTNSASARYWYDVWAPTWV